LENLPLGYKQTFPESSIENAKNLIEKNCLGNLDKATIMPSCCKVSHTKLFFQGDMGDYI